ncbi:hypothetical protein CKO25_20200 [Thiocapsa imhoffii]|uniref:Uncharacterized protein n=2 Tax=Thiocapsa imhoffii TaxID=382777 RepID=A0A9X0WLF1_9GAMM|nr:hypothetical protein [Thiocapsa imhoffii]
MYPVTQNKNNLSALSLKRHLCVCWHTAWRLKHKLLEAIAEHESCPLLTSLVVADDAVVEGQRRSGKHGRGAEVKAVFPCSSPRWKSATTVIPDTCVSPLSPIPDLKGDTLRS